MAAILQGVPVIPKWDTIRSLITASSTDLTLFSPFYTASGMELVRTHIPDDTAFSFWTRLRLNDWAFGATDPDALIRLLQACKKRSRPYSLNINQRIHSKAYFADTRIALIGSANLTDGAFENNLELMIWLYGSKALSALHMLSIAAKPHSKEMSLDELKEWVEKNRPVVTRLKKLLPDVLPHEVERIERDNNLALGFVEKPPPALPSFETMHAFISWLERHPSLGGARLLLKHSSDKKKQRRQGHFKQCFFGVYCFLQARPEWQAILSQSLTRLDSGDIFDPDESFVTEWKQHLHKYANTEIANVFSYPFLRNVLPPTMGGICIGGGGAIGTLKRMFPLVARFLFKQGRVRKR